MYRKTKQGTMSEWLGNGLQNRLQQFESAWYLKKRDSVRLNPFFCMACRDILHLSAATNPFLSGQYKNAVVKRANVKISYKKRVFFWH